MNLKIINLAQIAVSLIFIALILIQSKGMGLSGLIETGGFYRSKRGLEKIIFILTIIFGFTFILLAFINLLTA